MENNTNVKIPKKYHKMIKFVDKDCDGYWVSLQDDYINETTCTWTIHEYTVKDLLQALKYTRKRTSDDEKWV